MALTSATPQAAARRDLALSAATVSLTLRVLLVAGCAMAIACAAWRTDPGAFLKADPALGRLLKGIALLKGGIVAGAVAAVLWRFGGRVSPPIAIAYLLTCWMLTGTTMLIWQLTAIPAAAVLFHAALIGGVLATWRDDGPGFATRLRKFSRAGGPGC